LAPYRPFTSVSASVLVLACPPPISAAGATWSAVASGVVESGLLRLRTIMDQLLSERESVNRELRRVIDELTEGPWGIRVERVEIKDVSLPEGPGLAGL
jgi:hypothetical protein